MVLDEGGLSLTAQAGYCHDRLPQYFTGLRFYGYGSVLEHVLSFAKHASRFLLGSQIHEPSHSRLGLFSCRAQAFHALLCKPRCRACRGREVKRGFGFRVLHEGLDNHKGGPKLAVSSLNISKGLDRGLYRVLR